jgi:hypothetical protein
LQPAGLQQDLEASDLQGPEAVRLRVNAKTRPDRDWLWASLAVPTGKAGAAACRPILPDGAGPQAGDQLGGRLLKPIVHDQMAPTAGTFSCNQESAALCAGASAGGKT